MELLYILNIKEQIIYNSDGTDANSHRGWGHEHLTFFTSMRMSPEKE